MFKKLISILKLCPKSGLKHSVDHAQGIGMKFKICFFRFFLVEIWFKNDISIKNMSCLTLNPTSVNNHNAQYAHKHAISTQRGVTTGETQREKNNGENDANCEMSFCEKPPCPKICFAKIWFPQGCVCENPGYPGPWFAKDQGQIFLKRCFYPCFAKNRHAQKYVLRKSGFPKDVFAKILDIQDRGLRKIRVRSFSKDLQLLNYLLLHVRIYW